jgi:hypothetical protein
MKRIILAIILALTPTLAHAKDQGFFECFHLSIEQQAWFNLPQVNQCCKLADGMPVRFEERGDGIYVPSFAVAWREAMECKNDPSLQFGTVPLKDNQEEDRSNWVRVEPQKVLKASNPIGVGVVWWANAGYRASDHDVRCFVGLDKV